MSVVGELTVKLLSDARDFERGLSQATRTLNSFGTNLVILGRGLNRYVTQPIVEFGKEVVTAVNAFETQMNRVEAITGESGSALDGMREKAKELGISTVFSATQAADAMAFFAMAGFEADQIMAAIGPTLDLAAAGMVDIGRAADIVTNIMTGYGIEARNVGFATDVLTKTFTSSNTTIEMLGASFKFVGPVAHAAGLKFTEVSAAIGLLGNAGIQAGMAGRSLRMSIVRMLKPTEEMKIVMEKLGLTFLDASGNVLPLNNILDQLRDKGASTSDIMTLFGVRAGPAMASLLNQGSAKLRELTRELESSEGTAKRIADTQMQGLPGAIIKLTSAFEGLKIAIGESGLTKQLTEILNSVTEWVRELAEADSETISAVVSFAMFAAGLGPVVLALGFAVVAVAALAMSIGALLSPIGLIVAAFVGMAGATIAWNAVTSVSSEGVLNTVTDTAKSIVNKWNSVKGDLFDTWGMIASKGNQIWNAMKEYYREHVDGVKSLFWAGWTAISGTVLAVFDLILGGMQEWAATMSITVFKFSMYLQTILTNLLGISEENAESIVSTVISLGSGAINAIVYVVDLVKNVIGEYGSTILATAIDLVEGATAIATDLWNAIAPKVAYVLKLILDYYKENYDAIRSKVIETYGTIKEYIATAYAWIVSTVKSALLTIKKKWEENGATLIRWYQGFRDAAMAVWNNFFLRVYEGFIRLWDSIHQETQNRLQVIKSSSGEQWSRILTLWSSIWNTLGEFFTVFFDMFMSSHDEAIGNTAQGWTWFLDIVEWAMGMADAFLRMFLDLLKGEWVDASNEWQRITGLIWEAVVGIVKTTWEAIKKMFWDAVTDIYKSLAGDDGLVGLADKALGFLFDTFMDWIGFKLLTETGMTFQEIKKKGSSAVSEFAESSKKSFKQMLKAGVDMCVGIVKAVDKLVMALNAMIDVWNVIRYAIGAPKLPTIDFDAAGIIGQINAIIEGVPGFATGGLVRKPTLAHVGEKGPEAIIPLRSSGGFGGMFAKGPGSGEIGPPIIINVQGSVITEQDLAKYVLDLLIRYGRRNGGTGL